MIRGQIQWVKIPVGLWEEVTVIPGWHVYVCVCVGGCIELPVLKPWLSQSRPRPRPQIPGESSALASSQLARTPALTPRAPSPPLHSPSQPISGPTNNGILPLPSWDAIPAPRVGNEQWLRWSPILQ